LLGTRRLAVGDGLWLKPCRQVHMLGMRDPLDVVFLDDDLVVVRAICALAPGRISPRISGASSVLELPAGTVDRAGLAEGAQIAIAGPVPAVPRPRGRVAGTACNVVLAALFGLLAAVHLDAARRTGRWATLLPMVVQEGVLLTLFLTRRRPIAISARRRDWLVGMVGLFLPLLLRPAAEPGPLVWLGRPVQIAGVLLGTVAALSLGRSIGVVAANRGVKAGGLYRLVRHPLYAGQMLGNLGYAASYPTLANVLIALASLVTLNVRVVVEERLLGADPSYREYLRRTRWRLVPFVY
jgi:protein-S-isoprenylcysteine O-methyltransferase Ste14